MIVSDDLSNSNNNEERHSLIVDINNDTTNTNIELDNIQINETNGTELEETNNNEKDDTKSTNKTLTPEIIEVNSNSVCNNNNTNESFGPSNNKPIPSYSELKTPRKETSLTVKTPVKLADLKETVLDKSTVLLAHNPAKFHPEWNPYAVFYSWDVYKKDKQQVFNEIFAGVIVAFAQVPESIAFAYLAGVNPIVGLHSAWIIGFIVHATGGRPAMISGAAGGIGAILTPYTDKKFGSSLYLGVEYLPWIIIFAGVFVIISALLNVSKMSKLIPETVLIGFVNGLSLIIARSQVNLFKMAEDNHDLPWMVILVLMTIFITLLLPNFKYTKKLPSAFTAIIIVTIFEYLIIRLSFGHDTPLIRELGAIKGGWPKLPWFDNANYPDGVVSLNLDSFSKAIIPAVLIGLVCLTEDAVTMDVVEKLTETKKNSTPKQQLLSEGFANIVSGFFGTMGGNATIGLSLLNVHIGADGYYRISGVIASILVLLIILIASPLLDSIPIAALIGVMCVVIYHMFKWKSLITIFVTFCPNKIIKKMRFNFFNKIKFDLNDYTIYTVPKHDAIVIILVTVLCNIPGSNLTYAVISGMLFNGLSYSWQNSREFNIKRKEIKKESQKSPDLYNNENDLSESILTTTKVYYKFNGPLFFGSSRNIYEQFKFYKDPKFVYLDFKLCNIYDFSALYSLKNISRKYDKIGKKCVIINLNNESYHLIHFAGNLNKYFHYTKDSYYNKYIDETDNELSISTSKNNENSD